MNAKQWLIYINAMHPSVCMTASVDTDFEHMFGADRLLDLTFREEPYQAAGSSEFVVRRSDSSS